MMLSETFLKVSLLTISVWQIALADDDCSKVIKHLPASYSASMQITTRTGGLTYTSQFEEYLDMTHLLAAKIIETTVVTKETPPPPTEQVLKQHFIFNRRLEGIKKFLRYEEIGIPPVSGSCKADDVDESSFLNYLFGFTNEEHPFPSITAMLHFTTDGNWKCMNDTDDYVKGVPVVKFVGSIDDGKGKVTNTTYYWTIDHQQLSIPVAAEQSISRVVEGTKVTEELYIDFSSFIASPPPHDQFYPPRDIHCQYRTPTTNLKNTFPTFFSMETETVIFTPDGGFRPHTRTEYHDVKFQASRADYRNYVPKNVTVRNFTTVSSVQDWFTGLEYITDKKTGNCVIKKIELTPYDDLIVIFEEKGHVHLPTAMQYFFMDEPMSYNGWFNERGIMTSFYERSLETFGDNMTFILGLADPSVSEEGTGFNGLVPISLRIYNTKDYLKWDKIFRQNIVNFENGFKGEPFNYVFDITQCFPNPFKFNFRMRVPISADMDLRDKKLLEDELRDRISVAAKITSIRVQNIVIDFSHSYFYIIATLIDFPSWVHEIDPSKMVPEATTPLYEAKANLEKIVTSGKLIVTLPNKDSKKPNILMAADKGLFEQVDRYDNKKNRTITVTTTTKGWSSGSMAALGIFMLLISTAGFIALFKFVWSW